MCAKLFKKVKEPTPGYLNILQTSFASVPESPLALKRLSTSCLIVTALHSYVYKKIKCRSTNHPVSDTSLWQVIEPPHDVVFKDAGVGALVEESEIEVEWKVSPLAGSVAVVLHHEVHGTHGFHQQYTKRKKITLIFNTINFFPHFTLFGPISPWEGHLQTGFKITISHNLLHY